MIIAAVILISCGGSQGTAVAVEGGKFLSAEHITKRGCENLTTTYEDAVLDVSAGTIRVKAPELKYSCEGIITGQKYRLLGYHDTELHEFEFIATPQLFNILDSGRKMLRGLDGLALPGMSGGPVINENNEVVAIISSRLVAQNLTLVAELWRTELCSPSEPASS